MVDPCRLLTVHIHFDPHRNDERRLETALPLRPVLVVEGRKLPQVLAAAGFTSDFASLFNWSSVFFSSPSVWLSS